MLHLGRNIFSLVLSRILSGVILFLIYTRLVQYLGPEAAGEYGLLASYLTVFNFFVDLGMAQLVIKKMSEDRSHISKYLTNYFWIQAALGIIFMVIMDAFVLAADYPAHVKSALYIAGLGLLLSSSSLPFRTVVVAVQKLTINAQVNFFSAMINAGMMALAIILKQNIFFLAFISVSVSLFELVFYGILVNRRYGKLGWGVDLAFVKQIFVWNTPFMFLTFFSIYNRIDGLILPHLRSFVENGYYAAAYKFWDTLAYFPGVLGITLYPFFAEALSRNSTGEVRHGLETYTRYMIAVALPMALGAFLLADQVTLEFFGPEFAPAANALWLLVLAVALLFIYTPVNSLIISQLTKTATKITGINLLVNVALNLILIPKYGFVAAAAVTVVSEAFQLAGYTYFVKRRVIDFSFFVHFLKPLAASAAMGVFVYFFRDRNIFMVVGAAGAIYAASLFILRFFRESDWELFKAAVSLRQKAAGPAEDQGA